MTPFGSMATNLNKSPSYSLCGPLMDAHISAVYSNHTEQMTESIMSMYKAKAWNSASHVI